MGVKTKRLRQAGIMPAYLKVIGMEILARSSWQRQSINVILALSNKGGFWCHVYSGKFTADKCVEYFQRLLRNRKPPVILIVDTHPVNKSKKVMNLGLRHRQLVSTWLTTILTLPFFTNATTMPTGRCCRLFKRLYIQSCHCPKLQDQCHLHGIIRL